MYVCLCVCARANGRNVCVSACVCVQVRTITEREISGNPNLLPSTRILTELEWSGGMESLPVEWEEEWSGREGKWRGE